MPADERIPAYRFEDTHDGDPSIDAEGKVIRMGDVHVTVWVYKVTKFTAKGYFVDGKFVRNSAHKKFAYLTLEDAKKSYLARKKSQMRYAAITLERARKAISLMESGKYNTQLIWTGWDPDEPEGPWE